jgi:2-polyprenyl-6-methoxyphenol hydroxylase-like FAD-dependent oxidoreductase
VLVGKKVEKISQAADDGVELALDDGTTLSGSIVVGCDGVNSIVRQSIWDLASRIEPDLIGSEEKATLTTSHKCMFGTSRFIDGAVPGDMIMTHNDGFSFLILNQSDVIFWLVIIKLPETLQWPERGRYTAADVDAEAEKIMDCPINKLFGFRDLWEARLRTGLTPLEEGVFEHWHFGRMVLVGDSAHKVLSEILKPYGVC